MRIEGCVGWRILSLDLSMSTSVKIKEAGLAGNLHTVPLSDLFQLIVAASKTGMLSISRDNQKREIYFKRGSIVYASSSGSEDELLGNLLLTQNKISKSDLERALSLQKLTGKKLGAVLLEMTLLTQKELVPFLQYQVEEIVYNLFGWNSGEFIFYEGKLPPAEQITTQLNTMNVIMEGSRRIDEWIQIREVIPEEDVKLQWVLSPKIKSSTVTLTADELQLFPLIDGEKTVSELLQASPQSEFYTRKALYKLITSGLVQGGEKKKIAEQKKSDEELLSSVIIKLYSDSYQTIERMASRKLGEGAKKILRRCFDDQKSIHSLLRNLESSENFLDFSHLEKSPGRLSEPVVYHRLLDGLNDLLLEFLKALFLNLGSNLTRQVITQIKKETSQVVAGHRWIVKEYGIEEELLKILKKSQRHL
jgi:hypothetical protein